MPAGAAVDGRVCIAWEGELVGVCGAEIFVCWDFRVAVIVVWAEQGKGVYVGRGVGDLKMLKRFIFCICIQI